MRKPLTPEQIEKRRTYHREWERKTYALKPRVRVLTPEQKAKRHESYLKNKEKQIAEINARRKANPLQRKKWDLKYYRTHPEQERLRSARWKKANPEKAKEIAARCKLKHAEKYKEAGRKRHWLNRDKALAYNRRHRERFRTWAAGWRKKNPDKVKAAEQRRVAVGKAAEQSQLRRARIRGNRVVKCGKIISLLRLMPLCQYCFTLISGKPTIDHVIPISRGGAHAPGNLVAACPRCNSQKHNKLLSEWSGRRMEEAA